MVRTAVWKVFIAWTALFWGGTAALGALFFAGVVEFETSTRVSLYGTSVWLNGCLCPW